MYTDKSILSFWTDVNFAATSFSQKQAIKKTKKKSYTHFEITGGPCNLISSKSHHFFCFKSHLFPSQWGGYTENKTTNQISRRERQRVSCGNHTYDFKSNSRCALVRFWNHAYDFSPNCTSLSSITIIYHTLELLWKIWIEKMIFITI